MPGNLPMPATATAARPRFAMLGAFSRRWWALWFAKATRGESTKAMVDAARCGRPWQAIASDVPSDLGFVAVEVASPAFSAWSAYLAERGVSMPRPGIAKVVFVPSALPPERN